MLGEVSLLHDQKCFPHIPFDSRAPSPLLGLDLTDFQDILEGTFCLGIYLMPAPAIAWKSPGWQAAATASAASFPETTAPSIVAMYGWRV